MLYQSYVHTRRSQLRNAINPYQKSTGLSKVPCTRCAENGKKADYARGGGWIKHNESKLPEENLEDVDGDESYEDEYSSLSCDLND